MLNLLIKIEIFSSIIVFIILLFIKAPYGRHFKEGFGFVIPSRYAWIIMESFAFFIFGIIILLNFKNIGFYGLFFASLWELHYFYRTFIYPFLLTRPQKPFPFLIVVFGIIFNVINGCTNGLFFVENGNYYLGEKWILDFRFIIGISFFIIGFFIHFNSDKIIRTLKKKNSNEYFIPNKGLFRIISCPNYLGEIIEWSGFALATWSLAAFAFALFTFANLFPRALSNHKWYKNKFPEYPKNRKAIIPFLI
jgi:hypothetical protein